MRRISMARRSVMSSNHDTTWVTSARGRRGGGGRGRDPCASPTLSSLGSPLSKTRLRIGSATRNPADRASRAGDAPGPPAGPAQRTLLALPVPRHHPHPRSTTYTLMGIASRTAMPRRAESSWPREGRATAEYKASSRGGRPRARSMRSMPARARLRVDVHDDGGQARVALGGLEAARHRRQEALDDRRPSRRRSPSRRARSCRCRCSRPCPWAGCGGRRSARGCGCPPPPTTWPSR